MSLTKQDKEIQQLMKNILGLDKVFNNNTKNQSGSGSFSKTNDLGKRKSLAEIKKENPGLFKRIYTNLSQQKRIFVAILVMIFLFMFAIRHYNSYVQQIVDGKIPWTFSFKQNNDINALKNNREVITAFSKHYAEKIMTLMSKIFYLPMQMVISSWNNMIFNRTIEAIILITVKVGSGIIIPVISYFKTPAAKQEIIQMVQSNTHYKSTCSPKLDTPEQCQWAKEIQTNILIPITQSLDHAKEQYKDKKEVAERTVFSPQKQSSKQNHPKNNFLSLSP